MRSFTGSRRCSTAEVRPEDGLELGLAHGAQFLIAVGTHDAGLDDGPGFAAGREVETVHLFAYRRVQHFLHRLISAHIP